MTEKQIIVIACGGRNYQKGLVVNEILGHLDRHHGPIACVKHGGAGGADKLAGGWARRFSVQELVYPADWNEHGRAAGPIRNREMAESGAHFLIAFPGGRGTENMIECARRCKIPIVHVPEKWDGAFQLETFD